MRDLTRHILFLFYFSCFLSFNQQGLAQCSNPIAVFPYTEGFEINNGVWGLSNTLHWQWGAIVPGSKNIITAAGRGQKCWIVGGLSGANYSGGSSSLSSPCFDISSLVNPEVCFKVIWETEKDYDGVNMEYSTDGGTVWQILGNASSNANCNGVNWYNSSSIRFIGYKPGWSGSVQGGSSGSCLSGGGSGQWLLARHSLASAAGATSLMFRFNFGAGTVCNDYEGFAFDDFIIRETPPVGATFDYTCLPNNQVSFLLNAAYCQNTIAWNFGDPTSGAANASTLENPSHTFSAPGTYHVTANVTYSNAPAATLERDVTILSVNASITQPILCHGDQTGAIAVAVTGGNGNYNYTWNTNPPLNTASISGLSANAYTVNVSATDACQQTATVTLQQPMPLVVSPVSTDATCTQFNGAINVNASGGTTPYAFLWSNGQSTPQISNLNAGIYSLVVTDHNNCSFNTGPITIQRIEVPAIPRLGGDTIICDGQTLLLRPGNFASYRWQDGSANPTFLVTQTGRYYVDVTNAEGCSGTDTINVTVKCYGVHFPNSFTPNGDGRNDTFGPVGDLSFLMNYRLDIFNRWGQKVFSAQNPYDKWDGKVKGIMGANESFVWMASYMLKGVTNSGLKGTITLLK